MFLDDELVQMCKDADLSTSENIQKLNQDLCYKCQEYYKSHMTKEMSYKDVSLLLDRTFNLWDSFCKTLIKGDTIMKMLGEILLEHSFKMQLLSNDEVASVYNRGKFGL